MVRKERIPRESLKSLPYLFSIPTAPAKFPPRTFSLVPESFDFLERMALGFRNQAVGKNPRGHSAQSVEPERPHLRLSDARFRVARKDEGYFRDGLGME